jgi:hypothetical protein
MALWGNNDAKWSGGTVSFDYANLTVTGSGTSFGQVGAAATGDVIRFGSRTGTYYGDAVIIGITSDRVLSIASTSNLSGAAIASTSFTVSELPKYTTLDSHYRAGNNSTYDAFVYGVSESEAEVSTTTSYDITHSGWVGVTTYMGSEGEMRVKTETLVAMSSIGNDASDDLVFPDASITILTQPSSVGIATTTLPQNAVFSVSASVIPSSATLSYQWQESADNTTYADLTNVGIYTGTTTATLSIGNTDTALDGYYYRVVITTGDTTVTSGIASVTFA